MKKLILLVLTVSLVLGLSACGGEKKLVVWTFTQEIADMINDYYLEENPDLGYEIEVVIVPNETYQTKLDPVLQSGSEAPDVFALEYAYVRKYVESDFTMDLSELGLETGPVLDYVKEVGSNGSTLKALSWQATPGAFFYRRSIAEDIIGASDPASVQAEMGNWDDFLDLARKVNTDSEGAVKMLSSVGDIGEVFLTGRDKGWVVDGKLEIDPKVDEWLETSKILTEEELTQDEGQWSEGWFASMSGDNVFGYFLPTWGLHYVLKPNSANAEAGTDTAGDWGMVQGPTPYFWGGTWLAVREGTKMDDEAADLIQYLTLDASFLEQWATDTGDFLGNADVVASIKDDYAEPFLMGQNHYQEFYLMAQNITADILTGYDLDMRTIFNDELDAYRNGEKTKAEALADFKTGVESTFSDVEVN